MILFILITLLALLFVTIIITISWVIGTYNLFQRAKKDIEAQWSNIKTEYQRRADLLMNIVEATKSYKKFEKATMTEVIQARSGNFGKTKLNEMKKMGDLEKVFSKLAFVMEAYPNFKANEQHNKLMEEIRISEDRINVARTDYNWIVRDFNTMVVTFPKNLVARRFRFKEELFFENVVETNHAPKINLDQDA